MQTGLTLAQHAALRRFKSATGESWKAELIAVWVRGSTAPDGPTLRATRSTLGLDGLARVTI